MRAIDNFCGRENGYERTITLRNRLIPVGKTEENIECLISSDRIRTESYPRVKEILDKFHKLFIEVTLNEAKIDWNDLYDKICEFKKSADSDKKEELKSEIETIQQKKRKEISKLFTESDIYKTELKDSGKIIKAVQKEKNLNSNDDKREFLNDFGNFSTYFINYCKVRENLYKDEEKSGEIAYRLVNENFNKFCDNIVLYKQIKEKHSEVFDEFLNQDKFKNHNLDEIFIPKAFNMYITQNGIDKYNEIISGISAKASEIKVKGINECINLYNQSNKDNKIRGKMSVLYKQILSDGSNVKNFYQGIDDSKEALSEIEVFRKRALNKSLDDNKNLYEKICDLFKRDKDESSIYVQAKNLSKFSIAVYGQWDCVKNALLDIEKDKLKVITEKELEKIDEKIDKSDYSIECIGSLKLSEKIKETDKYKERLKDNKNVPPLFYFDAGMISKKIESINEKYAQIVFNYDVDLTQNESVSSAIKAYLDAEMDLYHYLLLVDYNGENSKDTQFYEEYDRIKEIYSEILGLYNSIRNFITKKASDVKKIKINFDCPTLAKGWDKKKENDNNCIIMRKNNVYYLAIKKPKAKVDFSELELAKEDDGFYEKMFYKLLPGPNKMLPKVFFSDKGIEIYNVQKEIIEGYNAGRHKIGENFDENFLHKLIDFYKDAIKKNEDWRVFDFEFKNTEKYTDINQFYSDIERNNYKIWFENVSDECVNKLVEEGKLFLFQIYNKDFAKGTSGKKNLHTLYFENLFSDENLKSFILKLNGEAELFLRDVIIKNKIVHKQGSVLVNKIDKDGNAIPDDIYDEIYKFKNGKVLNISEKAQENLDDGKIISKEARYDITKDERFTKREYFLHLPITMNKSAKGVSKLDFNKKVRECVLNDKSVKVIGLDRGERNLVYLCLINQKGEIEYQESLNSIVIENDYKRSSFDYQQKLTQIESNRQQARQNWKKIENIKELKQGYLSAVVYKIAKLMVDNNAIVVMEDLNFGFKHSRTAIERQVYQNFENALLEKLNYLVFKDKQVKEKGGVLNAYQLSLLHKNVHDVKKQSGFCFYIPASWTSKIDPVTGFANLFDLKGLTNREKKVGFFKGFDKIYFDRVENCFAFEFDYNNKQLPKVNIDLNGCRTNWTVYSKDQRLIYNKITKGVDSVDLTKRLSDCLDEFGIEYRDGRDLRGIIQSDVEYKLLDYIYWTFRDTLQMRNSVPNSEEDYLISPVKDKNGNFYDSRVEKSKGKDKNGNYISKLPVDADANGAYNIARKGLYLIEHNFNTNNKGDIEAIKHSDWFKYVSSVQ